MPSTLFGLPFYCTVVEESPRRWRFCSRSAESRRSHGRADGSAIWRAKGERENSSLFPRTCLRGASGLRALDEGAVEGAPSLTQRRSSQVNNSLSKQLLYSPHRRRRKKKKGGTLLCDKRSTKFVFHAMQFVLSLCSPSLDIPAAMHFLSLQYWQRLRLMRRMLHCWFLVQGRYWIFCWMERRKKPWKNNRKKYGLSHEHHEKDGK